MHEELRHGFLCALHFLCVKRQGLFPVCDGCQAPATRHIDNTHQCEEQTRQMVQTSGHFHCLLYTHLYPMLHFTGTTISPRPFFFFFFAKSTARRAIDSSARSGLLTLNGQKASETFLTQSGGQLCSSAQCKKLLSAATKHFWDPLEPRL